MTTNRYLSSTKRAIYQRAWRKRNPDSVRKSALKWYHANRDKAAKTRRAWKRAHPDRVRLQAKQSRDRNVERVRQRQRDRYHSNRESLRKAQNEWRAKNREHCREQGRAYAAKHASKRSAYAKRRRVTHPHVFRAVMNRWRAENRVHVRYYYRNRLATNIQANLRSRLANRLLKVMTRRKCRKSNSTLLLLGTSLDGFKKHLESLFKPGMSWENRSQWHLDHIRPCASFDLTDPEQQKKCFHYTNFQPLWWSENLSKSDKWGAA
jgi:hypothetical protein